MVMKAHLANLPPLAWALIGLPALYLTRCVLTNVVPQVVHAVVPEAVRVIIRLI
jgi:hypothetical protein